MKHIIAIAALVIAALMVTGYAILESYDFNNYKPKIAQAVKEATGRELKIDGDIKVKLGLSPMVLVKNISFQNAPWGSRSELAKIKCLRVQLALFPLIKGIVEVKRLIIEEPDILLETDLSGKSNLELQTDGQSSGTPPSLLLKEVKIERGLLTYRGGESGKTYSVSIEKLIAAIPDGESPIEVDSQGALNGRPFEVKGTLGSIRALIDPVNNSPIDLKARFGGASIIAKGEIRDAFNVQGLALTVAAKGPSISEFIGATGITDMPDIGSFSLEAGLTDSADKLSIEKISLEAGSKELAEVTIKGAIEDLLTLQGVNLDFVIRGEDLANIRKLGAPPLYFQKAFTVSGKISSPATKNYRISDLKILLGENKAKGRIDLNFTRKRPRLTALLASEKTVLGPFKLALNLSGPADKLEIEKLDLNFGSESLVAVKLTGAIKDLNLLKGVNLNFTARGKDLANLEKLTGRPLPVKGAFSAFGKVIIPAERIYKLSDLKVLLGNNDIGGSLVLDLSGREPEITAELSSKKVDLTGLLTSDNEQLAAIRLLSYLEPVKMKLKLIGHTDRFAVEDLDFNGGTEQLGKLRLTGVIKDLQSLEGMDLSFVLKGDDVANLKKVTSLPMPIKGLFIVSGQVANLSAKAYKFSDLKVALGENNFKGSVDLNLAGKLPRVVAALSSQKLDLRPILQRDDKSSHPADRKVELEEKKDKVFSSDPLSLGALKVINGNFKMQAGQILLPRMALDDFTAEIILKDGHLMVNPIKSLIGGGSVQGRFDLHPQGESAAVEMEMKIDKVALGRMLKELGVELTLEGTLDVKLNVNTTGGSIAELMAGLRGDTIMVMGEGRIDNKHIEFFGADLSRSIFRLINPFKHKTNYTEVNCFVSRFDIKDGLADCTALVLDTKQTTVIGDGEIDLKSERLNISFKPSPKKGVGVSSWGKISFSLSKLTDPFKLGGTLANPSLVIDPTQAAITLGKLAGGLAFGAVGIAVVLADVSTGDENP
ncbi:MAG: AsmA family protein [Deltaproteobacteria bacterium]|nr:AsmA family protein [Deltaproteobacteria bacterium]